MILKKNHERKRRIRFVLLTIMTMSFPILLGADAKEVLKGADQPFVDLGVLLSDGGKYLPNDMIVTSENVDSLDNESNSLLIRIRGNMVFVDDVLPGGKPYTMAITECYRDGMEVKIVDDYADYLTYVNVVSFLEEQGIRFNIE